MNLTTVSRFKTYKGISGTALDAVLAVLIPQVSEQIALYLGRDLESTTYRTWADGLGGPLIRLRNWPITAIYQVSISCTTVMRVKHETAIRAFVSFDGTNVSLTSINSEGTATTSDLATATYKILSTLEAAIEALGWTVELSNPSYATEPTLLLRPIFAQDALSPDTADLYLADMHEGVKLINQDMIERTDDGYFPSGSNNIFVWYKAGYTLPTDESDGTLPAGLLLIVHQLLNDVLSTRDKTGEFQSESLGDYSYSRGQIVSAIQNRKKDLDYYKRVTI